MLLSAILLGGFPTGWTGYAPLSDQARGGIDAYLFSFALIGIALALVGLNIMATVVTMRAPGMTWNRIPIFVWGLITTSILAVLAAPVLLAAIIMCALDRTVDTSFFLASQGGSPFLWDNLFWFFGHPEVYILALPGFGIVLEILPVFARKPLWGYRLAVSGMFGVALLSFMVWQHHLFVSGINANLRPFYMFTTELISVPTGLIFLNAMGTLWRAKIRFTVPMLFALAFFFNFLIGGISGVYLSDVPSDVTTHGSYFVMAHFHYTIMGGLVFALMAGLYFWLPKMTGLKLYEKLGKLHFWTMFIFFNTTFFPLFAAGLLGMPRRVNELQPRPARTQRVRLDLRLLPGRLDADPARSTSSGRWSSSASARSRTRGSRAASSGSCPHRRRSTTSRRSPSIHSHPVRLRRPRRPAGGRAPTDARRSRRARPAHEHLPGQPGRDRRRAQRRHRPGAARAPMTSARCRATSASAPG